MFKRLVRLLAFFGKEFNEVRRQPKLVLSLILGPFLILLLFGLGYRGTPPTLRIALVVPQEDLNDERVLRVQQIIDENYDLVYVGPSESEAMGMLDRGEADVVEVVPPNFEEQAAGGSQIPIAFRYYEINPIDEQWLQYTGYVQINALNQAILMQSAGEMQDEAAETSILLSVVDEQLGGLSDGASEDERAETRTTIQELDAAVLVLLANPALAAEVLGPDSDPQELQDLHDDLTALDQSLADGNIEEEQERIRETRDRVQRIEQGARTLAETPSNVLVNPLELDYQNVHGQALDLVTFYAPGVLALILQHIAVTLGALSLVRERLIGALEVFSVSPASMMQVLMGKILAYTLFILLIGLALVGLMVYGLKVPFLGDGVYFMVVFMLFILASLGIGLFLSTLSGSDTQAVQLSMIVLLVTIFFSGFVLPLEQFYPQARILGYMLPTTHAMDAFQHIMLTGAPPALFSMAALTVIMGVTMLLTMINWGAQFRKLQ